MARWLCVLLCTLMASTAMAGSSLSARKRMEVSTVVTGAITVTQDGHVQGYTLDRPERLQPVVTELLKKAIPSWTFEPVLVDGKAVVAKTRMSVRLVARPTGDEAMSMGVESAYFGDGKSTDQPHQKVGVAGAPPRYPEAAIRARVGGTVYLLVRIGRQGTVEDVIAEQVNLNVLGGDAALKPWRNVLGDAAVKSARQWVFDLPTSGSQVNAEHWVLRIPVAYRLLEMGEKDGDAYGKWDVYLPGPREVAPWFDQDKMFSGKADAIPSAGAYPATQSLTLKTSLSNG